MNQRPINFYPIALSNKLIQFAGYAENPRLKLGQNNLRKKLQQAGCFYRGFNSRTFLHCHRDYYLLLGLGVSHFDINHKLLWPLR